MKGEKTAQTSWSNWLSQVAILLELEFGSSLSASFWLKSPSIRSIICHFSTFSARFWSSLEQLLSRTQGNRLAPATKEGTLVICRFFFKLLSFWRQYLAVDLGLWIWSKRDHRMLLLSTGFVRFYILQSVLFCLCDLGIELLFANLC